MRGDEALHRWLDDILGNIRFAQQFVGDLDAAALEAEPMRLYAVIRCLEIISEASRRLPDDLKARHPDIPWRAIAGAGNIYRHDYSVVVARFIWVTVTDQLPPLATVIARERDRLNRPNETPEPSRV